MTSRATKCQSRVRPTFDRFQKACHPAFENQRTDMIKDGLSAPPATDCAAKYYKERAGLNKPNVWTIFERGGDLAFSYPAATNRSSKTINVAPVLIRATNKGRKMSTKNTNTKAPQWKRSRRPKPGLSRATSTNLSRSSDYGRQGLRPAALVFLASNCCWHVAFQLWISHPLLPFYFGWGVFNRHRGTLDPFWLFCYFPWHRARFPASAHKG